MNTFVNRCKRAWAAFKTPKPYVYQVDVTTPREGLVCGPIPDHVLKSIKDKEVSEILEKWDEMAQQLRDAEIYKQNNTTGLLKPTKKNRYEYVEYPTGFTINEKNVKKGDLLRVLNAVANKTLTDEELELYVLKRTDK